MAKEILYRIDFEGADSQLNNLTKIGDELQTIQNETKSLQKEQKILNELNKDLTDEQKKQLEELKIKQKIYFIKTIMNRQNFFNTFIQIIRLWQ